jgi:ATP-dependent protease ClpP protease subunit
VNLVDRALMARVQHVLNARKALPRAKVDGRPKLQVVTGLEARDEDGGGTYTDLLIYDEIGWWGINSADVAESLAGIKGDLNVRLNSPGGDVFDGIAIYNQLADHNGQVTVTVDGLAASAASFIAMAGDRIVMNRASQMMIHDASGLCIGNATDMTDMAGMLDTISGTIAGIYADRTGVAAQDWRALMLAETWYDAAEAVDAGLATDMAAPRQETREPVATFDLAVFQFAGRSQAPAPPAVEPTNPDVGTNADVPVPIDVKAISSALSALKGATR